MKTTRSLRLLLALVVLLPACSSAPKVQTQAKPGADHTRYRTFALLPLPATGPVNDPGLMLRVAEPARHAVVESLTAKGLAETDLVKADLTVNLRGQTLPKVDVQNWGYNRTAYTRYGPVPVRVGEVDVRTYEERTLTVEIFDNHSKELIWTGWSTRQANGPVQVEKLQETLRAILAQYPPAPTPPAPAQ